MRCIILSRGADVNKKTVAIADNIMQKQDNPPHVAKLYHMDLFSFGTSYMESLLHKTGKCYNPIGVIIIGIIALFFYYYFYKLKGLIVTCIRMQ